MLAVPRPSMPGPTSRSPLPAMNALSLDYTAVSGADEDSAHGIFVLNAHSVRHVRCSSTSAVPLHDGYRLPRREGTCSHSVGASPPGNTPHAASSSPGYLTGFSSAVKRAKRPACIDEDFQDLDTLAAEGMRTIAPPSPSARMTTAQRFRAVAALCVIIAVPALLAHSTTPARGLGETETPGPSGLLATCEPAYQTISRAKRTGFPSADMQTSDASTDAATPIPTVALVSMHDTRKFLLPPGLANATGLNPSKEFDFLAVGARNRAAWCKRHGYTLVDATSSLRDFRPPNWYKIKAVESYLHAHDWVFWLDADAWITSPAIGLDAVLPADGGVDLVITNDPSGVNSGAWLLRNSTWSHEFLKSWWQMETFVQDWRGVVHNTKSGDNDALKALLRDMPPEELAAKVAVAPQCAFNSALWRPSLRQFKRWIFQNRAMRESLWQPGHFLIHFMGFKKPQALQKLTHILQNEQAVVPVAQARPSARLLLA